MKMFRTNALTAAFAALAVIAAPLAHADELASQVRSALFDEAKLLALGKFADQIAGKAPRLAGAVRGFVGVSKAAGPLLDLITPTPANDVRAQANEGLLRLKNEILLTGTLLRDMEVDYSKHAKGQDPRHGADYYANHLQAIQERIKTRRSGAKDGCDAVRIEDPQLYSARYSSPCKAALGAADAILAVKQETIRQILPKRSPLE